MSTEASEHAARVLREHKVRERQWRLPRELFEPRPTGPPFTTDDLLDYHLLLEGSFDLNGLE